MTKLDERQPSTQERTMNATTNKGLVKIGDWGFGGTDRDGAIWCKPEDREAVQAAYDAIEEGDLGPTVLDGVYAAGGILVAD